MPVDSFSNSARRAHSKLPPACQVAALARRASVPRATPGAADLNARVPAWDRTAASPATHPCAPVSPPPGGAPQAQRFVEQLPRRRHRTDCVAAATALAKHVVSLALATTATAAATTAAAARHRRHQQARVRTAMSLRHRRRRGPRGGGEDLAALKAGDAVYRLKGLNAYAARVRAVDAARRTATLRIADSGGTEADVPFEELERVDPDQEAEAAAAMEALALRTRHGTGGTRGLCRLLTRVLAGTLVVLWFVQLCLDLRDATFGVEDSGLIVRLAFFGSAVALLFLSSRCTAVANRVLLPLGLRIPVPTQSTTSQGLSLPRHWFDKIAPLGTHSKNPAVVDPDPGWNYVNKHRA